MRIPGTLFAIALLAASVGAARSEPLPPLDGSCETINSAYVATRNTESYSEVIYNAMSDGTMKHYQDIIVIGEAGYQRYTNLTSWQKFSPRSWRLFDLRGPKFTDCQLLDSDVFSDTVIQHFSLIWHKFPFEAPSEMWISSRSGKMTKFVRHYPDKNWEFSFPVAVEIFDYDPAKAITPDQFRQEP